MRYARGVFRAATRAEGAAEDLQLALEHAPEDWSNRREFECTIGQALGRWIYQRFKIF